MINIDIIYKKVYFSFIQGVLIISSLYYIFYIKKLYIENIYNFYL